MFVEKLSEYQINKFRLTLPIKVDNKTIPFRVFCANTFYNDPRGNSPYIMFFKDFSCRISHCDDQNAKEELNRLYIKFMRETFGKEYDLALSNYLYNKSETIENEHTLNM